MFKEGLYTISELQTIIKESNEFKAKLGKNVEKDNSKNNEKAVEDIIKDTNKTTNIVKKSETKNSKNENSKEDYDLDLNKTMLDLEYDGPGPDVETIKKQVIGDKDPDNKSVDNSGNEQFYKERAEISKKQTAKKTDIAHSGLTSHNLDRQIFEPKTAFNNTSNNNTKLKENKIMKRLHFKNTRFLSESQMLSKIPEDYKIDGNVFLMKDSTGAEFIVECIVDEQFNFAKFNVASKPSKEAINEEFKRMEKLYEYKSSDYNTGTTFESRKNENENVSTLLETIKQLQVKK